jgi:hypothetical protein
MSTTNNLFKALLFAGCAGTASANQVRELPLEKKVSSADIVFIGTVQKTGIPENDVVRHDYLAQSPHRYSSQRPAERNHQRPIP